MKSNMTPEPQPQLHPQPEPQGTPQESQHQLQLHPRRLQKSRRPRTGTAIGGIFTRKKERSRDDSKQDISLREPDKDPDAEKSEERDSLGSGPKKKHKKKRKKKAPPAPSTSTSTDTIAIRDDSPAYNTNQAINAIGGSGSKRRIKTSDVDDHEEVESSFSPSLSDLGVEAASSCNCISSGPGPGSKASLSSEDSPAPNPTPTPNNFDSAFSKADVDVDAEAEAEAIQRDTARLHFLQSVLAQAQTHTQHQHQHQQQQQQQQQQQPIQQEQEDEEEEATAARAAALNEFYTRITFVSREIEGWVRERRREREEREELEVREYREYKQDKRGQGKMRSKRKSLNTLQESRMRLYEEQVILRSHQVPWNMGVGEVGEVDEVGWRWFQCTSRLKVLLPPDASHRYTLFLRMERGLEEKLNTKTQTSPNPPSSPSSSSSPTSTNASRLRKFSLARRAFIDACLSARPEYPVRGITPTDTRYAIEPGFRCRAVDEILEGSLTPSRSGSGSTFENNLVEKEKQREMVPQVEVDMLDLMTLSRKLVPVDQRRVGSMGSVEEGWRRWVRVGEGVQMLFPADIAFQYHTFLSASTSTSFTSSSTSTSPSSPCDLSYQVFLETFLEQCLESSQYLGSYGEENLYILSRDFSSYALDALRVVGRAHDIQLANAAKKFAKDTPDAMVSYADEERRKRKDSDESDSWEYEYEFAKGKGKGKAKAGPSYNGERRIIKAEIKMRERTAKERLVSSVQGMMEELEPIYEIPSCASRSVISLVDPSRTELEESVVSLTLVGTRNHTPRLGDGDSSSDSDSGFSGSGSEADSDVGEVGHGGEESESSDTHRVRGGFLNKVKRKSAKRWPWTLSLFSSSRSRSSACTTDSSWSTTTAESESDSTPSSPTHSESPTWSSGVEIPNPPKSKSFFRARAGAGKWTFWRTMRSG
ncbi:hypothetical protein VKT23_006025 [Stygiomarasmius scandens]|uniref:Uncharacterized protein n=1 Tax=Marasmiellus scandens TaxID=2682957 RepID=A0ABR1JVE5_9AGAR